LAYNHQTSITATLDGILMQQSEFRLEILIYDDASTDRTQKIIKSYVQKYPDVIKPILSKVNYYSQGVAPSPKFNLSRAKGDYIAMCECDDRWTDVYKLQKQLTAFQKNPNLSLCATGYEIVGKNGSSQMINEADKFSKCNFDLIDFLRTWPNVQTLTVLFKNYQLDWVPSICEKNYRGSVFVFLHALFFGDLEFIPDVTAEYYYSGDGIWSSKSPEEKLKMSTDNVRAMQDLTALYSNHKDSKLISKLLKIRLLKLVAEYVVYVILRMRVRSYIGILKSYSVRENFKINVFVVKILARKVIKGLYK